MNVKYAGAWMLSFGAAVSSSTLALMLLISAGCNEAKVASDRQSEAPQVATVALEPVAEEKAEVPIIEEKVVVQVAEEKVADKPIAEASKIEVVVEQPTEEAILVRAETEEAATEIPTKPTEEQADSDSDLGKPTHKQIATIAVNSEGLDETSLHSFCLTTDGNVLAACGEENGEVRVFDHDGKYLTSWNVAIQPEAINVGSDGNVYIAGQGKLLKLNNQGEVLLEKESPHVAALTADPEKIREQVIEQAKASASMYDEQLEMYQKMIDQLREKDEEKLTNSEKQSLKQLEEVHAQFEEMAEENSDGELTEERIDELIASTIEYKMRTASISESDGSVFIATGEPVGYGYEVWKMDTEFENGKSIVSGLSGCCGQMDVQACSKGIYVAENSRHRVVRYDSEGQKLTSWGSTARSGLRGFGSCCNPMNVAFGPDGSVYTSESNTGRIKRFDSEGQLLALVGKVDLVPGCDKVAISVSSDGNRVYMLDITRNKILVMGKLAPGETVSYAETDQGESTDSGGAVLNIFKKIIGL